MQRLFRDRRARVVRVLDEGDAFASWNDTDLDEFRIAAASARRSTNRTHDLNMSSSASFVASSGRFCKKRILFGGWYSSGTWMTRRGAAVTSAVPAPDQSPSSVCTADPWLAPRVWP